MKFLSWLLILLGFVCLVFAGLLYWERINPQRLDFSTTNIVSHQVANFSQPKEIIVPDLKIDLPLIPSKIVNGQWETTYKGASYLASSPIPGQNGNSIIYGHNFTSLFGPLVKAKVGEKVSIVFADGSVKNFQVKYISQVSPQDVEILKPSQDSRITLYTCSGFLDSKRFVVVATLES